MSERVAFFRIDRALQRTSAPAAAARPAATRPAPAAAKRAAPAPRTHGNTALKQEDWQEF